MDKKLMLWISIIIITCIVVLFGTGYYVGKTFSDGWKCVNNPLVYGIEKFNEVNYVSYGCDCYQEGISQRAFYFDKNGVEMEKIEILFGSNQNFLSSLNSSLN